MNPRITRITRISLTGLLMVATGGYFAWKNRKPAANLETSGPESAVWRMVEAARLADADLYMSCYTGDMEQALRRNLQEMGADRFRAYLTKTHAEVKGIAVSPPEMASPEEGRVPVEYVYSDRNEVQQVHVRRVGRDWKIFRVDGAERVKTLVPYGTPVAE